MDVESETSVKNAASETKAVVHEVDRIINVAGVLHEEGLTPEKRLSDITPSNFEKVMRVNAPAHCYRKVVFSSVDKSPTLPIRQHFSWPVASPITNWEVGTLTEHRIEYDNAQPFYRVEKKTA